MARSGLLVYPNPVNELMTIEVNLNHDFVDGTLQLIDLNGRVIITQEMDGDAETMSVDVSKVSSGVYLLRLFDHEYSVTQKVVIE